MFKKNLWMRFTRQDVYTRPLLPALLVFIALMAIIGASWRTARQDIKTQQKSVSATNAAYIENTIRQRFNAYEDTLRAANGLFLSSESVTRDEWTAFINTMKLPQRYPGVRSVGYLKLTALADRDAFIESNKQDNIPNYHIYPEGDRALYAPVTYVVLTAGQPGDSRTSDILGFDMLSEPVRKAAMDKAAASGEPTLSGTVSQLRGPNNLAGFLLYMPQYKKGMPLDTVQQRQAALEGYFYAPFASKGIFGSMFNISDDAFGFTIYGGKPAPANLIYQSSPQISNPEYFSLKQDDIMLYGQHWTIVYKIRADIVPYSVRARPLSVVAGGSIFAAALALIIYLLIQRRTRALGYREHKKLEEAKDELLSLASHQLRTPATAVKQYVSMVKEEFAGPVSSEQRKLLQMAYDSNERQLTIVDDLLYVARVDAGKATLKLDTVQIDAMLQSVIDDQQTVIKNRKQKVKFKRPAKPIKVEGDQQYLRMIFENLLSNASKYSKEQTEITVRLIVGTQTCTIDFIDNGVGINPKDYDAVFKKFSRIPNELTRTIAGSGIGLYLARQLSLLHGGDITFVSDIGKGSTFTVEIPRVQSTK